MELEDALLMDFVKVCLFLSAVLIACTGCEPQETGVADGFLEISYQFNMPQKFEPSFQTVIWLEDQDGQYIKSLFVSDYLAYDAYDQLEICSTWSKVADWENVPEVIFDAITMPTPYIGPNVFKVDCAKEKLVPGVYHYGIEVHIADEYNIMYRGKITIGKKDVENLPKISYNPDKVEGAENVISDVKARYYR